MAAEPVFHLFREVRINTPPSELNGFGDYPDTEIVEVGTVTAATKRKAQNAFKKQFPQASFSVKSAAWFVLSADELAKTKQVVDLGD